VAIAIVQLVKCPERDAPKIVEELKQQNLNPDIIELVEAVLVSKFKNLSREEIEAMFALSDLKNTRVYKDAVQEGVRRGLHRGWQKGKEEGKQEGKKEGKKEGKQEIALNLLRIGMDVVQVSQVTGLTVGQVSKLQEG